MQSGMRFIPYQQFVGLFIPNVLAQCPFLGSNAKLVWGRLAQFAGADGICYPNKGTIAFELGCSEKTIARGIKELCDAGFLESEPRYDPITKARKSNKYYFLWHEIFTPVQPSQTSKITGGTKSPGGEDKMSPQPGTKSPSPPRDNLSPKENHISFEENQKKTTTTNKKNSCSCPSSQVLGWIDSIAPTKDDPDAWKAKMLLLGRRDDLDLDLLKNQADKVVQTRGANSSSRHQAVIDKLVSEGKGEDFKKFLDTTRSETVTINELSFNTEVARKMIIRALEKKDVTV